MRILRYVQLVLAYFIALGAIAGVMMMVYDPTGISFGMDSLIQMMKEAFPFMGGLFKNLYPSAVALFLVVGVPNIVSIVLIHKRTGVSALSGLVCGIILSVWILVELYAWGQNAMSMAFGIVALIQIINAIIWKIIYK